MICLVGGGEDGAPLAMAFARASLPGDCAGLIVTGPFMPPAATSELRRIVASKPNLRVVDFLREPMPLLAAADGETRDHRSGLLRHGLHAVDHVASDD